MHFSHRRMTDPNVLEVIFVGTGIVGVAAIFWPAALILTGILGVVACERSAARRVDMSPIDRYLERVA